jgi:hypothetical protein
MLELMRERKRKDPRFAVLEVWMMSKEIHVSKDISNLPLEQNTSAAPTTEQVYVLSSSELQDLITSSIEKATAPILEELNRFKGVHRRFAVEKTNKIEELQDWIADLDCKIKHIKPKDIRPSISTQRSIDKILDALHKKENVNQYLTYKQIGDLLGVSKGRVCQLRVMIKSDGRLTISEHPTNHKERIVTLNPQWGKMV